MSDIFAQDDANTVHVPRQLVKGVRRFMQDFVEVNELFEGEETADQVLAEYIVDECAAWNAEPPMTHYADISPISLVANARLRGVKKWIIDATAARALKSVIMKLARNDMPYTAGNVTVQPNAVWRNLQPIVQDLELQYKEFRRNYKISKNAESAFGVSHSEMYVGTYENRDGFLVVHI